MDVDVRPALGCWAPTGIVPRSCSTEGLVTRDSLGQEELDTLD